MIECTGHGVDGHKSHHWRRPETNTTERHIFCCFVMESWKNIPMQLSNITTLIKSTLIRWVWVFMNVIQWWNDEINLSNITGSVLIPLNWFFPVDSHEWIHGINCLIDIWSSGWTCRICMHGPATLTCSSCKTWAENCANYGIRTKLLRKVISLVWIFRCLTD